MKPWLALVLTVSAMAETCSLEGYVFREADGAPPRRQMTIELAQQGKVKYRQKAHADGFFQFRKIEAGAYSIVSRFGEFVSVQGAVTASAGKTNFAALMLIKRRAGTAPFATVSVDQLASRTDSKTQKKLREAGRLARAGDFPAAINVYEQVLAVHPTAETWDAVALLYWQQGRDEEAYRAFENAIARDPKFLFSYAHLASIHLDDGHHKDVVEIAERALALDPKWFTGELLLAEASAGLGQWDAAHRHAQAASELVRGKSPAPYLVLARARWAQKDCPGARQHLARYLDLLPSARAIPELHKPIQMIEACQ